jgi:hypothetical protein
MTKDKKIPQADIRRDTRVSKPRNPETIRLPDDEGLVKDESARTRVSTSVPVIDPRLVGTGIDPRFQDDPANRELFTSIRKKTPQESFDPKNAGSLARGSFFDIPPKNITDSSVPDFSVNNPLFESPPQTVISVIDDGVPVISDVDETTPAFGSFQNQNINETTPAFGSFQNQNINETTPSFGSFQNQNINDKNSPAYGDSLPVDSRRRAPPPVSFNPGSSATEPNQIPSAPGIRNLPREWQNLPENFQSQLRRLLPIYYDITGPFSNLVDVPAYVPPPLFDTTPTFEGETGEEGFIKNETEDVAPMEPPNRSNIDFLNLLNFLFNLILSADSDIYEVVSFTRIEEGGASSPDVPVAGGEAPDAAPGPEAETPGRFTQETREFPDGSRRRVVLENGEVVATLSADRVPPPQNEIPSRPFLSSPVVGDGLV